MAPLQPEERCLGLVVIHRSWWAHLPHPADLTDDLSDCSLAERDSLRDWQARLYSKYKIGGEGVKGGGAAEATASGAATAAAPAGPAAAQ